ncbi:MAG: hypothetical protein A2984_00490 [Omnitrophica WOR_2 bacterium RIFCSPLOWO2_01_FULL_41_12]|nr:MAG: hypothetical protein A2984_00490 [Omnitrophica WOR_2 bacterium RIFCSPLOWO2_01_FULL_41_12]
MTEEIKDLIEKIQQEGIATAQQKAKEIEEEARIKAEKIIQEVKSQAEKLMQQASLAAKKAQESGQASLKQAGRDLLISLKKEINQLLDKIILTQVSSALSPQELAKVLSAVIKHYQQQIATEVKVLLKKEDQEALEKHFLKELKEEAKKGIVLQPSDEIRAGFMISFDKGKSYFDFTDKALGEYISIHLQPRLRDLLG